MDKNRFRFALCVIPALAFVLMAGCATPTPAPTPSAPEPQPEPAQEPAPQKTEPASPLIRPDYPERYVVVKGDTLWDIAGRFLHDPWRWPEVWQKNPEIENPHLIYPGDILTLIYIDGRPTLQVERGDAYKTVKLSPTVREYPIEEAIPTIPMDAIGPFLSRPRVISEEELEAAPWIVSSADEHLIASTGNRIYVRGIDAGAQRDWVIVRPGALYHNPDDPDDILGREMIHVGEARLQRHGDPATLHITASSREVLNGDRLLPAEPRPLEPFFHPRSPADPVSGHIIAVLDGLSQIGQYHVVTLDLGEEEGMAPGHVLAVSQSGKTVRDPLKTGEKVVLPEERAGTVMIFRVFDRVSYALVMKATRAMHVMDRVSRP